MAASITAKPALDTTTAGKKQKLTEEEVTEEKEEFSCETRLKGVWISFYHPADIVLELTRTLIDSLTSTTVALLLT